MLCFITILEIYNPIQVYPPLIDFYIGNIKIITKQLIISPEQVKFAQIFIKI